nr:H352 [uncultured bacterium]
MSWFPSRHPEMDRDFYLKRRPWPHEGRLFVKRFGDGKSETGYIRPVAGTETSYELYVAGALARDGIGVDDLMLNGWEVD